jgi:cell division protein ZapA
MPQVTITINGHPYAVACDTGQEQRIRELARLIDGRVAGFAQQFAQAGEARLLVLAALMLADELTEANEATRRGSRTAPTPPVGEDSAVAAGIERLAQRIEAVASRLETPQI